MRASLVQCRRTVKSCKAGQARPGRFFCFPSSSSAAAPLYRARKEQMILRGGASRLGSRRGAQGERRLAVVVNCVLAWVMVCSKSRSHEWDGRCAPEEFRALPAQPGAKETMMCGGAASRELPVCLAQPSPAQPNPSRIAIDRRRCGLHCAASCDQMGWAGSDLGRRRKGTGTRTRTGQRWQSRYGTCILQRQKVRVPCFSYKQTL